MKKIISRIALVAVAAVVGLSSLSAQEEKVQYRAELGFGLSQMSNYGTSSSFLFAPRVSGQVLYNFSNNFGVLAGLSAVNKGEIHSFFHSYGTKSSAWYLQVPVNISYRVDLNTDNRVYIEAGPYFAFGLSGKEVNGAGNDTDVDVFKKLDGETPFNRFEYGLGLNLAYNYRNIYFRLGYENSLSKVVNMNSSFAGRVAGGSSTYGIVTLGVGYQF